MVVVRVRMSCANPVVDLISYSLQVFLLPPVDFGHIDCSDPSRVNPGSNAYHGAITYNGVVVPYGVVLDLDNNGCSGGYNMATSASYREFANMLTDTGNGLGWSTNSGNEIGECNAACVRQAVRNPRCGLALARRNPRHGASEEYSRFQITVCARECK